MDYRDRLGTKQVLGKCCSVIADERDIMLQLATQMQIGLRGQSRLGAEYTGMMNVLQVSCWMKVPPLFGLGWLLDQRSGFGIVGQI